MLLYYAMGGGLGHLTRFGEVCRTLGLDDKICLITSSPFSHDSRVVKPGIEVKIPPFSAAKSADNLALWINEIIATYKPDKFFVDAFPGGLIGELCKVLVPSSTEVIHIARILKWNEYKIRLEGFCQRFSKTYVLEDLEVEHNEFLKSWSDEICNLQLMLPEENPVNLKCSEKFWLVIHAGSDNELKQIINVALEDHESSSSNAELIIVTPGKRPKTVPDEIRHESIFPAFTLFEKAERVYSAAGFNMVDQMRNYRNKHYVMPFARLIDNQFRRCEQASPPFAKVFK